VKEMAMVAPVHVVVTGPVALPPGVTEAMLDDPAQLAAAAGSMARSIVAAATTHLSQLARGGTGTPTSRARAALRLAMDAARDPAGIKRRLVVDGSVLGGADPPSFSYTEFLSMLGDTFTEETLLAKLDAVKYFYCLRLAPASRRWFCFRIMQRDGSYVFYRLLRAPMGGREVPLAANVLTSIMCMSTRLELQGSASAEALTDDAVLGANRVVQPAVGAHRGTMKCAGVGENAKTVIGPVVPVLGRVVDAPAATITLPRRKAYQYATLLFLLQAVIDLPSLRLGLTQEHVEKLCGCLVWYGQLAQDTEGYVSGLMAASYATTPGAFAACMWTHNAPARRDLAFWTASIMRGAIRPVPLLLASRSLRRARVAADASNDAGGATFCGQAWHHVWTADQRQWHINGKEAFMLVEGVDRSTRDLTGMVVTIATDSLAVACALRKGRARDKTGLLGSIFQRLVDLSQRRGFTWVVVWLARETNLLPDEISYSLTITAALTSRCSAAGYVLSSF